MTRTMTTSRAIPGLIRPAETDTLGSLFRRRAAATPEKTAYREVDRASGAWRDFSWGTIAASVDRWRAAYAREGLAKGDRLLLLCPNGVTWACADLAALHDGLIVVPGYLSDAPENTVAMLAETEARILVVHDLDQWLEIRRTGANLPALQRVVVADPLAPAPDDGFAVLLDAWLDAAGPSAATVSVDPHDLATIVYTAGTTGPPKGVMLSHRNLISACAAVPDRVPTSPDDVFISYLPIAHVFERTVGYYLPMMAGSVIAYARSVDDLLEDLQVARPTVFLGVPRIYERVVAAVEAKAGASAVGRKLLEKTLALGWERFKAAQGRGPKPSLSHRLVWPLLARLICKPVHDRLGGRVRVAVSGGAPLADSIARFLISLGLPLIQGYGMTETSAPVCTNALEDNVVGSLGTPLDDIGMRISEEGELLVRGPGVMQGYWKDKAKTRAALEPDGWLHTGDRAELREGRVYFTGRLKEIIVLSTGEKVAPHRLEAALTIDPLIEQAMVVGDSRPCLLAVLVLNREEWAELAAETGLDPADPASLAAPLALDHVLASVTERTRAFPDYARIRKVLLTLTPWTIDNGLVTPTLKLKRPAVTARYTQELDALYAQVD